MSRSSEVFVGTSVGDDGKIHVYVSFTHPSKVGAPDIGLYETPGTYLHHPSKRRLARVLRRYERKVARRRATEQAKDLLGELKQKEKRRRRRELLDLMVGS